MRKNNISLERRNEIIKAAEKLFYEKGYDNASTTDILKEVGIAKGTLYYYFKSKEEIMNAIIDQTLSRVIEKVNKIADDDSISVFEKIIGIISSCRLENLNGDTIREHIHKPQNALMHQIQLEKIIKELTPILTKVICHGIDQGIFHTDYPYESVEMILIYSNIVFDDLNEMPHDEIINKLSAFINNCALLLGAEKENFKFLYQLIQ